MKTIFFFSSLCFLVLFSCVKQPKPAETTQDSATVSAECTQRIIHARVFLKPDKVTDFIQAARGIIDSSNMEPGCISYQLFQDPFDPAKLIFVEVWKDQAAIDAHFNMPYFISFGPKTSDWLAQPTELKIFSASDIN